MSRDVLKRKIIIPPGSPYTEDQYIGFLKSSYVLMRNNGCYFAPSEGINSLELAHLLPEVVETLVAIYVGINDAVCNKGLVAPILLQHGHNNVFVFDPAVYSGGEDVPAGTVDVTKILPGFEVPNDTWDRSWTYVMIEDPSRTFSSLWLEKGYIDLIPAKFEDFTMVSDHNKSRLCVFISPKAFDHPVNISRPYLREACFP